MNKNFRIKSHVYFMFDSRWVLIMIINFEQIFWILGRIFLFVEFKYSVYEYYPLGGD